MKKHLVAYAATFAVMFLLDMVWLGVIAADFYQDGIGHLMTASPRLVPAALFYLMFPAALMFFAVLPQRDATVLKAAGFGAMLGLCAYATYDLTNLATLRDWPVSLSVLDTAWGTLVSGLAAGSGRFAWAAVGRSGGPAR